MGEAKRRKEQLGDKYGQSEPIMRGLPITKKQSEQFIRWTTRGSWIGIGVLVAAWVVIRFVGPAFGWWQVTN
jgi:Protein of unknown function (DUF2839)